MEHEIITSDFGAGLTYCLGLFLAHTKSIMETVEKQTFRLWFYEAGDHLLDFQYEQAPTEELKNRCKQFRDKVLCWRLPHNENEEPTKANYTWAIQEAKDLLMEIDKANNIKAIKAELGY